MKTKLILLILLSVIALTLTSYADVPHLINFQGRATDTNGAPLNGTYNLTFRIYDHATAGNLEWQETYQNLTIVNGIFQVLLGSVTALDLPFDEAYWITIEVNTDGEMSPRTRLASVGYAYRAEKAEVAESLTEEPTPAGSIMIWATDVPPTGWLLCDGGAVSRTGYADLFSAIGTTYGAGDGADTFNLPDMRGRVPLGQDDMGGASADRVTESEADTLGSAEGDEDGVATHTHSETAMYQRGSGEGPVEPIFKPTSGTTGSTGTPSGNMPPYLTLNYIIKT